MLRFASPAVLTKLANGAPVGLHKIAWSTIQIGDLDLVHVDPQPLVKRGEDFLDVDRAIDWPAAARVGGTDDLSRLQSTASDQYGLCTWPVVASPFGVNSRGTPKFSPDDHGDVVGEPALVQVIKEDRERVIECRQVFAGQVLNASFAVGVPIPSAKGNGDTTHTHFYQPACQ